MAEEAKHSLCELTDSMQGISRTGAETQKIVKTIDGIASRTNLLVLNAAVEAVRARETGAGFAVVVDEMRQLAMRATEAAKSTSQLIGGTVAKVESGAQLVARTSEAFEKAVNGTKTIGDLVCAASEVTHEQARRIEQLDKTAEEIDLMAQRNAINAQESASASQELNAQTVRMRTLVAEFVMLTGRKRGTREVAPLQRDPVGPVNIRTSGR